jgi:hypothetical protein
MALDLSNLNTYTDELSHELITQAVAAAETMATGVTVIEGVKHAQALNYFNTDAIIQPDGCGFTPSGTTPLTKKTLTVCPLKVEEALCPKDYNSYWAALKAPKGSKDDSLVFAEAYTTKKAQLIAEANDKLIWQGDTDASPAGACDGWLKQIAASGDVQTVVGGDFSPAYTSITAANVLEIMYAAEAKILDHIRGANDLTLYVSKTVFRLFSQAMVNANSYYQSPKEGTNFEAYLLGTNVKVVGINGLSGVNDTMVLTRASNLVVGTDLVDEVEGGNMDLWYSKDNRELRFSAAWKIGVQIYFEDEVIYVNI